VVRRAASPFASLADLAGRRVAIPGARTTANMVMRLLAPPFEPVVVPIQPFDRVFHALRDGEVDAAVLIHEGRLTFAREGFVRVADLGVEWERATSLPLPLGGNVVRRALGADVIARVSRACRASIVWALEHKGEVLDALVANDTRDLGRTLFDEYLDLYANADTASLQPDVARSIETLFTMAREKGLIDVNVRPEYAP
jgi:1,4-dihydroxy-6-naphthoate synthase